MLGQGLIMYSGCGQLGCDPELFIEGVNGIVGAERVIPKDGISHSVSFAAQDNGIPVGHFTSGTKLELDGVQLELHPSPKACRMLLIAGIRASFVALNEQLKKTPELKASFRSVVEVDQKELDALSESARVLGCAPSRNLYDPAATIAVDVRTYNKRSAGGHIHIDLQNVGYSLGTQNLIFRERTSLVPCLDILLGNQSVLIDRDPYAAERRQVYGRAGEYRTPPHGIEYRTLSNFWLRSVQLTSFVLGMSRFASGVLYSSLYDNAKVRGWDPVEWLLSHIDMKKVQEAINTNDFDMAMGNWEIVKEFLIKAVPSPTELVPLHKWWFEDFEFFVNEINKRGIERWFPEEPMAHWLSLPDYPDGMGWEKFLAGTVHNERIKANG